MRDKLTRGLIHELFSYDKKTDILFWKVSRSGIKASGEAGCINNHGYRAVKINGKSYHAHRLIWLYVNGEFPKELDHINHNRADNRIENLREVSRTENLQNASLYKNNLSGVIGVHCCESSKKWGAYITVNYRRKHLGYFTNKKDAIEARKKAERKHNFHENHGRKRKDLS